MPETTAPEPTEDSKPHFMGHDGRECGEHRTAGPRAWCFDCSEWCYPEAPCGRCEAPQVQGELIRLRNRIAALEENGAELLARAEQAEAERDQELERFTQYRVWTTEVVIELDALKAARCPSCDHLAGHHQSDGCWYTVTTGTPDRDLVCPCALAAPDSPAPVKHIGGRANAEDCPACTGDVPYPWICPGNTPESPATASTAVSAATEAHGGAGEAQEGSQ